MEQGYEGNKEGEGRCRPLPDPSTPISQEPAGGSAPPVTLLVSELRTQVQILLWVLTPLSSVPLTLPLAPDTSHSRSCPWNLPMSAECGWRGRGRGQVREDGMCQEERGEG